MSDQRTNPTPVRVLQVFHGLGMGGAETWLIEMLRYWAGKNLVQCDFLLTGAEPGIFDQEVQQLGSRIYVVPFGRGTIRQFVRGFRRVLSENRYDAIHDHQDRASGWHFAMGWPYLPRVRITHIHNPSYQIANNYEISRSRRWVARIGKRLIRRFTTHIAATSYQMIEEYGFTESLFKHIPKAALHCAFRTERFSVSPTEARHALANELQISPSGNWILFAGRMDQSADFDHPQNHKNSALAVEYVSQAIRLDPSIRLLMAGATSGALTALRQRIAQRGLEPHFHFLGIRQDIEKLMAASDLLLFPSRGEGLGMVAVEAQAAGVRVLASTAVPRECVVVPEMVTFKRLSDTTENWATAIVHLLREPKVDRQQSNTQVAQSAFSVPVCSDDLIRLYSQGVLRTAQTAVA